MLVFQNPDFLPMIFFMMLVVSVLSGLILLLPKVPLNFIRIHTVILLLPIICALLALIFCNKSINFGPWYLDTLSWLLALFVLTISFIVQSYCVHYLLGEKSYRSYFALLTITTAADSLAWLSNDLRILLICWGVTLLGLTLLIGLKKEWQVARNASALSGRFFALSWIILLFVVIWLTQATGYWKLSMVLSNNSLAQLDSWEKSCISLLFIVAVIIPAAQWPFHGWLLDSVIAPTPISAVMHAGIVNAGGIMLTRFSPLFSGDAAQIVLLVLSGFSVLMGTGIMLVQVDYKRQLVGSTIAQMGFMLIQCALGAYWAAIIHAVLHGIFKATLFLQAGSAVHHQKSIVRTTQPSSLLWTIVGIILAFLLGIVFWWTSPRDGYHLINTLILGWSVLLSWRQLVANENGRIGRIAGLTLFAGAAFVFSIVHSAFFKLLQESIQIQTEPPTMATILALFILLVGIALGLLRVRYRSSVFFTVIYLWLLRLSEPKSNFFESHPKYLTRLMSQGGK
ncbi:NAD(P)H-quinone oxidoreductase subunit 5 [Oikeobacillus pervagus]|uniref:Probable inorganic carbon transporter subunit DabB n=1 Tax=Oikeobacillus pervagus TaxID=1325931 RepID=A0AAJ1T0M9_9BACI|nr:NADH dehydrogenase subunit 5 [Oikeobacillus pervagus]MDQ0216383.1 NAD(P)H-quinone oxidoreductase subunit 5 [Oikeobacillus pervagus]